MNREGDGESATADAGAALSAEAAVVAAQTAAHAVDAAQAAVLAAAGIVAEAATAATVAVTAAVAAQAAVGKAAAAAAVARRTEAQLTHDVLHDDLTGLANRRLLVDRLSQALARSSRAGTSVAVLVLDLDGFKAVNDGFGHAAGDELLIGVARKLEGCLRDTDTCARIGGDEFVVVCEDLSHPSDGPLVAGRLETALAAGVSVGDRTVPVLASVGIAVSSASSSPQDLLAEADSAMYRAKGKSGRPADFVDLLRAFDLRESTFVPGGAGVVDVDELVRQRARRRGPKS